MTLAEKFNMVYKSQEDLSTEFKIISKGGSSENLFAAAYNLENNYDKFKSELLENHPEKLVKFVVGKILPSNSYSYNSDFECIFCLSTGRWINRKIFTIAENSK